jgi:hypothetical protein
MTSVIHPLPDGLASTRAHRPEVAATTSPESHEPGRRRRCQMRRASEATVKRGVGVVEVVRWHA